MRRLLFNRSFCSSAGQKTQSGFTLIELLLIIVLLGVLAVAAINAFEGNEDQGRENITRLEMVQLQKALLQFRRDTRELPCRVFLSGDYSPNADMEAVFSFESGTAGIATNPASPSTLSEYESWCSDSLPADDPPAKFIEENMIQAENALTMLSRFPYEISLYPDLLWNPSTQRGWNGPYVSSEALKDSWGRPYKLLNPELAFDQSYRCEEDGTSGQLAIDGSTNQYNCMSVSDGTLPADYTIPANIARIASAGPDGVFQSKTLVYDLSIGGDDPCAPMPDSDDLILCLLR